MMCSEESLTRGEFAEARGGKLIHIAKERLKIILEQRFGPEMHTKITSESPETPKHY